MEEAKIVHPSWWYAFPGVFLILIGASLFVYFIYTGISHLTDTLTQVVVPGQTELELKTLGKYTIFLEEQSVVNGRIYSTTESVNGLTCTVASQEGTRKLLLRHTSFSTSYALSGRSGRSVLEFDVTQAGKYGFSCGYPEGTRGPEVVVAVGTGVTERILGTIGRSLFALFGGGVMGSVIIVLVYFKRDEERKRLQRTALPVSPSSI